MYHIQEHDPRAFKLQPLRMLQWLAIALALYVIVFETGLQDSNPGLQTSLYTLANVTLRAYVGYWIARATLGRLHLDGTDDSLCVVARAILVGAVVLTSK